MSRWLRSAWIILSIPGLASLGAGCTNGRQVDEHGPGGRIVDSGPPPSGLAKIRVGVPSIPVEAEGVEEPLDGIAADGLAAVAFRTGRFEVIERGILDRILDERGLAGIVKDGELIRPAEVRGIDYLFLGRIAGLRASVESISRGSSKDDTRVAVECRMDLRLVDPATGRPAAACIGPVRGTESIGRLGQAILGKGSGPDRNLLPGAHDKGRLVRTVLDAALRTMLPEIDGARIDRAPAREILDGYPPPPAGIAKATAAVLFEMPGRGRHPLAHFAEAETTLILIRTGRFEAHPRMMTESILKELDISLGGMIQHGLPESFPSPEFLVLILPSKERAGVLEIRPVGSDWADVVPRSLSIDLDGMAEAEAARRLRPILDEALRSMLPQIDEALIRLKERKAGESRSPGKFCPSCGVKLVPAGGTCPACGAKIDLRPKSCPECGEKFPPGPEYCPECGSKL